MRRIGSDAALSRRRWRALAKDAGVEQRRDAMFAGAIINTTEERAVLHTALRNRAGTARAWSTARDVMPDVDAVLQAMGAFCRRHPLRCADGRIRARRFTDVVNIGIGGSDLGPVMATLALVPVSTTGRALHFVSNIDGAHMSPIRAEAARRRQPRSFIVASKTFTTIETITNASDRPRKFIAEALGDAAVGRSFLRRLHGVSTRSRPSASATERTFGFWDWVGGRYSIWSAIGLPLMIAIGTRGFRPSSSAGAPCRSTITSARRRCRENLPMLLGPASATLTAIGSPAAHPSRAILPYDQRLSRFPAYLQQLDMESNGKGVRDSMDSNAGRGPDRPGRLGRARHQRPARLLPAPPPGHGRLVPAEVHGRRQRPRGRAAPPAPPARSPTVWRSRKP
jgi:glucose-6-phosphate isomerase